jgi:signal transduction histidine kinase
VRVVAGRLELDVVNGPGAAGTPGSGGNGLRNMTERARELGGALWTGHHGGGGFALHARLPLGPAAGPAPAYAAAL